MTHLFRILFKAKGEWLDEIGRNQRYSVKSQANPWVFMSTARIFYF